jgi:hypothetical protein
MAKKKPVNATDETLDEIVAGECVEKLNHLMKTYGIEDGDYFSLALRLAIDHVPHFRPAGFKLQHEDYGAVVRDTTGGRPKSWTAGRLDALVVDVDTAKRKYGLPTDEDALKYITKRGKWARPANRDPDKWVKTLKNLLATHRKVQRGLDDLIAMLEEIKRQTNPGN